MQLQSQVKQPFVFGGCLGLGCLSVFVFVALITFGLYYTTRVALPEMVIAYTTDTPSAEPSAPSQEAITSAQLKMASLFRRITGRGHTATEEFTKDEVPALVSLLTRNQVGKRLPSLQIKEGKLHLGFSWPLKSIEEYYPLLSGRFPELHSRYVVGDLDFLPEIEGGSLKINVTNVNLNGHPLPGIFLRQCNRILNSLLTEMSAHIPVESPTQSTSRKISLNSISGIELKANSLKITLTAKERPLDLPRTEEKPAH
jgi:hypothetical protein